MIPRKKGTKHSHAWLQQRSPTGLEELGLTVELKSLLLCSDEKIVRVLRRTLGDLEIGVEHCTSA